MMEHPIQVGECIGCSICIRECPVEVMTSSTVDGPTPLAPRQGPITRPPSRAPAGSPCPTVTREALKPTQRLAVRGLAGGPASRPQPWQVWRR